MKKFAAIIPVFLLMTLLSGCLYPDQELTKNQVAYEDQIAGVQNTVDRFKEDSGGLLPIKTRDMKTPIYQKYPVDFAQLVPGYMAEPPGTAYENGGIYLYVLIDVEENPTVKLIDLRISEEIRDLKTRLNVYKASNGYPPYKDIVAENVFTLDYKKLGYKEAPQAISPYSGEMLPFVIDNKGEVYVDYRIDLFKVLNKKKRTIAKGEDIRDLLVEDSPFVPAFSLPYTVNEKNEPVFLDK
ncbi:hypothetical protein [Bacillus sp. UMB0893]|uniref:hypothetical protein n=1 Tax=Bacillus sp. UMB0893 TaxID=2066053 RepID=UPI000C75E44F|nr:hypothetical protein [Bacillus sp. UMB0893]PLR66997.1 hypothetical protein CYJ36_15880 [Bacillus sp. UMB0893]QNG61426.1 hypothetical protein H4O14_08110 [Bacillus sp. PAMC26568]